MMSASEQLRSAAGLELAASPLLTHATRGSAASRQHGSLRAPAWRDAFAVMIAIGMAAVLCARFDATEALRRWTAPWERLQLDELPAVLLVVAAGLAWFAARRWGEARRELVLRCAAEQRLAAALDDNRRLAQQYVQGQEGERKALARELHDELGQYLQLIRLDAVAIRDASEPREGPSFTREARARAGAIADSCAHLHQVLAGLIRRLRPAGLDELGLTAALEHCIAGWRPRLPGTQLELITSGELSELPEAVALTAYRVVQEALTNVAKHAAAAQVSIRVERDDSDGRSALLRVTVSDDGRGHDPYAPTSGLGLLGLRERVHALGGSLALAGGSRRGVRLEVCLPLRSCA